MNLILALKELWRRRLLVALAVCAAAAISVLAIFQVSPSPPFVSKRVDVEAHGSVEILVDSADSPIADARRDLAGLTSRASVFARYIAGGNVIRRIAGATGIPVKQIDVAGATPLPGEAPGAEEKLPLHPYGISIGQAGELPILSVSTRAPTVGEARALAAAAPAAIRQVVRSVQQQQGTPDRRRVQFRVLGPAQAARVDDALGKKIALALFVFLLAVFIGLILGVPRFAAAWRAVDPDDRAWAAEEKGEAPAAPEVLHLPGDRGAELEDGDRGTARVRQGEP